MDFEEASPPEADGRDKFSFFTPKRGRVLGLWIEQLVAESLGKNGFGILPNIEVDSLVLREDPHDRTVITYNTKTDLWDDRQNFSHALEPLPVGWGSSAFWGIVRAGGT